jgi:hypothetical protein
LSRFDRDRLLEGDIARALFERVLVHARAERLLSDEHFTVDGTLIEAWAGQKSFKRKGTGSGNSTDDPGNPAVDFKGEKSSNKTLPGLGAPAARLRADKNAISYWCNTIPQTIIFPNEKTVSVSIGWSSAQRA